MDIELRRGITETLEILKYMDSVYTKKIPEKFFGFLQSNKDNSYNPKIDYIQIYDISKEAKILLGIIYLKYWSNEAQQKEFLHNLSENQKKYQEELNQKYNSKELFKKESEYINDIQQENLQMIEYREESIFKKIIRKIKMVCKKK